MNRRTFLKTIGIGASVLMAAPILSTPVSKIALPTAPAIIPPARLDFGVPTQRFMTATEMPASAIHMWDVIAKQVLADTDYDLWATRNIPMLTLEYGWFDGYGGKLPAGSQIMVDRTTAERWVSHGVAVPGPQAPADLQIRAARHMPERLRPEWCRSEDDYSDGYEDEPALSSIAGYRLDWPVMTVAPVRQDRADVDAGWERLFAGARADGWETE